MNTLHKTFVKCLLTLACTILLLPGILLGQAKRQAKTPTHQHVSYGPEDRQWLNLYLPSGSKPAPVFIYAHHNGSTADDVKSSWADPTLAEGTAIVSWESIAEVQGPTDFQICVADAKIMFEWVKENATTYNFDIENIIIGGQSRGSFVSWYLAHSLDPGIVGIYMGQALPGESFHESMLEPITKNAPPIFLAYRKEPGVVGDIHDPAHGLRVVERYKELGIGDKAKLVHSLNDTNDNQVMQFVAEFVRSVVNIQNRAESKLDFYGGWKAKKLQETGYFHVKHDGHRWWLVTPEGNAFLSFGINHYHEHWWAQDYNKDYWVKEFGAEKPIDKKWKEGFRKAAAHDLTRLGINTLGMHTNAILYTNNTYEAPVPYIKPYKPIVLDHYRNPKSEAFVDVFSTEYEKLCDETAKKVSENCVNDPMLLGYAMSDCPIFTDMDIQSLGTTSWSRVLPNLGANAPGKKVYVELMQKHYAGIDAFNSNYNTKFSSWDDLAEAKNWRENTSPKNNNEKRDNEAFTLLCVDRYYEVATAALKNYDSNHLFFGDKLNGNTDNLEKVIEIAAKHVDAIVYQFYGTLEQQNKLLDKLSPKVKTPFINGDIGFSSPSEMIPNPYGPHAKNQELRAKWLKESVEACFVRPEFIGWHMCGVIDTWKTMPGKEYAQHQGIMTVKGKFYPEMEEAIKDISEGLYKLVSTKD